MSELSARFSDDAALPESLDGAPPADTVRWRQRVRRLACVTVIIVIAFFVAGVLGICFFRRQVKPSPPNGPAYVPSVCTHRLWESGGNSRRFSVWAPHASSVQVIPMSKSSAWQPMALKRSGNFWEADVLGVAEGDGYVFSIDGANHIDPCALDIASDGSHSVIPSAYSWRTERKVVAKEEAIVYEMHIGSFTAEGTFEAAVARLDYLKELGVTVLELMPVMYFCGDARAWGYNPCAPFAVKPELGGSRGLRLFVDAAAERGMAVAMDIVFNHLGTDNLLHDYDGWDVVNGIYFYTNSLAYVYGTSVWGPRPNYNDTTVANFIVDNFAMLIDEFHIGAFRWDGSHCMRKAKGTAPCWEGSISAIDIPEGWRLQQQGNNAAHFGNRSGTLTFAEDLGWPDVTKQTNDISAGNHDARGGAGFDAQWKYAWDLKAEFAKPVSSQMDARRIATSCLGVNMNFVLYSESHDIASMQNGQPGRVPTMVRQSGADVYWVQKKTMLFLGLLMTCPAVPMLLQGQELLSFANFDFPHPPTFDWSLAETNKGIFQETKDLIALRRNHHGTTSGLMGSRAQVVSVDGSVAVLHRWLEADAARGDVLVIYNFDAKRIDSYPLSGIPADGTWLVRFNGDAQLYSPLYINSCASQEQVLIKNGRGIVCLPGVSLLILSQGHGGDNLQPWL